jgi:hypothetical protein
LYSAFREAALQLGEMTPYTFEDMVEIIGEMAGFAGDVDLDAADEVAI